MFLFEKYRPKSISEFYFNRDIMEQLVHIASYEDIPHIIISGPPGGGKKTLVKFFLEELYGSGVNILSKWKFNVNGSSTKKEIQIMQSNYHIIIEPTSTNHDKYILQEIIKQYAKHRSLVSFDTNRKFKTIVIHNIENLANNSQAALRRTMELYAKTCRFVMICNNLSKVFDPLRSRCRTFCVSLPTPIQIRNVVSHIAIMEKINLKQGEMKEIIEKSNGNLKRAIWMLDAKRLNSSLAITLDDAFELVSSYIFKAVNGKDMIDIFDKHIRSNIYNILITNIKGSEIITTLMDLLIEKIGIDEINAKIIQYASDAEYNLIHGRRDIQHIDYFVMGVIKELIYSKEKLSIGENKGSDKGSKKSISPKKTSVGSKTSKKNNTSGKTKKKCVEV